ncbi:MAG: 3-isopropylmalate dehydratase small subunit, partial [Flavobacteriia bacterium]|nr:3-isopropylmalate dehydratase small subunit [Flavobacteriia bacterium]
TLFHAIETDPSTELLVDLPQQTLTLNATEQSEPFEINSYKKENLLNGYDDIDYLNNIKPEIVNFASQTPL